MGVDRAGGEGGAPFWERPLDTLTAAEWEALCDGCGLCCLHKLEAEGDREGEILYTRVACRHLDLESCRCRCYRQRHRVDGCVGLTPERARSWSWLPESCAYRRLAVGRSLPPSHPLLTGDPESVHAAGISVRGRCLPEAAVAEADLVDHVVDLPGGMAGEGEGRGGRSSGGGG